MNSNSSEKFNYTVQQLIDELKTFPPDLPVFISGYESGYENFYTPYIKNVVHRPDNMYFDGEFQDVEITDLEAFEAIILTRVQRTD